MVKLSEPLVLSTNASSHCEPLKNTVAVMESPGLTPEKDCDAAGTIRDLRVGEVVRQDIHLDEGGAITYRTKLQLSFKYEQ